MCIYALTSARVVVAGVFNAESEGGALTAAGAAPVVQQHSFGAREGPGNDRWCAGADQAAAAGPGRAAAQRSTPAAEYVRGRRYACVRACARVCVRVYLQCVQSATKAFYRVCFTRAGNRITHEHVRHVQETAATAAVARAESEANVRKFEQLSAEQERVLTELKRGSNVFFTGCGGTGKTLTLKSALAALRTLYGAEFARRVAVTAPTGIAASRIGGTTINLAAGVGAPKTHGDFNRVFGSSQGVDFRVLEVLVIDEVSMLSGEFLDALDTAVTKMRGGAAKRNAEQGVQFPDSLMDGEAVVPLCQAWQRLSLAKSLHSRLGAASALSLLPRNAQGGGDLHEPIAHLLSKVSDCPAAVGSDYVEGDAEAAKSADVPITKWQKADAKQRASLRMCIQMEHTARRWLGTEVEGGAEIVRRTHFKWLAFGGIQLLFSGDFFQLPPVSPRLQLPPDQTRIEFIRELKGLPPADLPVTQWPSEEQQKAARAYLARGHAFQSAAWVRADFVTVELTKVYRQDDREMVERLQVIRTGGEIVHGLSRAQRQRMAANRLRAQERLARRHPAASPTAQLGASPAAARRIAAAVSTGMPSPLDSVSTACRFFSERCQRRLPERRTANGLVVEATTLYAENVDVDRDNKDKLARLPGQPAFFTGHDGVVVDMEAANLAMRQEREQIVNTPGFTAEQVQQAEEELHDRTVQRFTQELWQNVSFFGESETAAGHRPLKQGHVPKLLELKVEAQVLLLVNLDQAGDADRMLVNGSRGVVSRVQKIGAIIRECEHQLQALRRDTGRGSPLKTTAGADVYDDSGRPRETALKERVEQLRRYALAGFTSLPYVDFWNGRTDVLIVPHPFESEVSGRGKCTRAQLPLKLAWSITIHKSQGLSLEAVRMDLSRCRTPGQGAPSLHAHLHRPSLFPSQPMHTEEGATR
jgi:hypothetical protein